MRLAVIFHRLGPYHVTRLGAAAQQCEVHAIELAAETKEYEWARTQGETRFTRTTLFPEGDSRDAAPQEVRRRMFRALDECAPEAVAIPGWSDRGALAALGWSLDRGVPAILMSESSAQDESRTMVKEFLKRRLVGLYASALVGGRLHADYLVQLGMERGRIRSGYDVVDNDYFARATDAIRSDPAKQVQIRAGEAGDGRALPEEFFLASARFIEKKNLATLLRGYAGYVAGEGRSAWKMVLLGNGPLRAALETQRAQLGLETHLFMPGFKQYDELPLFYALANAFVHASTSEQWGLVVNEAAASGLPLIVSNRCGCLPELVHDNVNGFTFNPGSADELTESLMRLARLPLSQRQQFGQASRRLVRAFDPVHFGTGLREAAEIAIALPRRTGALFDRVCSPN